MSTETCDVLVVGAGPAGSSAARSAATAGARVILIDRRKKVGAPVQCAEYIPAMLRGHMPIDRNVIAQPVKGMRTLVSGRPDKWTAAPGFTIHRDRFDRALCSAADDAGARMLPGVQALDMTSGDPIRVHCRMDRRPLTIAARVVIGADGPRSTVGRWVGAINDHLLPGVQVTLPLTAELDHTRVYFDPEIGGGYGWLFPKGRLANVGLGLVPGLGACLRTRQVLGRFVDRLRGEGLVNGPTLGGTAGWIPAQAPRKAVHGAVALVGDAAGHTHPITGAGVFAAVSGGEMAGRWAARAVAESDPGLLNEYDRRFDDLFGHSLARAWRRRRRMEAQWPDFEQIIESSWVAFRSYYA